MYKIVVKIRNISGTSDFSPKVNEKVLSNTRKLVVIVHNFGNQHKKEFLLCNYERPNVSSFQ